MAVWGVIVAVTFYFSFRVEKVKKEQDIHTFKEIVAFCNGEKLDEISKAKEEGKQLDEIVFRYPGPKPQTKEAAIISIADSVEAAVRSMKEPNAEKIQKLVQSIIQDRVQDDQFDECDISLKELKTIEDVLCETLNGTFHSRIEYPK